MPEQRADLLEFRGAVRLDLQAAAGGKKERRFTLVAYTGEPLDQGWWDAPVIVDLDGIDAGDGVLPILDNHGPGFGGEPMRRCVVGQSDAAAVRDRQFIVTGKVLEVTDAAREIVALADAGFAWQASIGAKCLQRDFVAEDNSVTVNGRTHKGPCFVSRKTVIREVSIVVIGADRETSAVIASGESIMAKKGTFAAFCKEKYDMEPDKMSAKMKAKVQAEYDDDDDDDDKDKDGKKKPRKKEGAEGDDEEAGARLNLQGAGGDGASLLTPEAYRQAMAAESARIAGIRRVCAQYPGVTVDGPGGAKVPLEEHAIRAGLGTSDCELIALRNTRAGGDNGPPPPVTWYAPGKAQLSDAVLECAVLQAGRGQATFQLMGEDFWLEAKAGPDGRRQPRVHEALRRETQRDLCARYTDQVQQYAHDLFKGRIGLQQLLATAAGACGYRGREVLSDGNLEAVLRAAFRPDIRAEGPSTVSLPYVLANILNKFLLQGYLFMETTWRELCAVRPVKDFKPTKSVNVFGDFVFKKLDADGQIVNAAMTDEAFANQIDTFARSLQLTRQMIINDDLNALTTAPMLLGIGSADAVNILFWTLFLSPGNWTDGNPFWSASHNAAANTLGGGAIQPNLISGGTSALSSASLQTAVYTYDKQLKPNGQPLGAEAEVLLVPPELWVTGWELTSPQASQLVYGGAAAAKQPNVNIWRGQFKLRKSRYLSNASYTGNSATAWWLLANPMVIPAIEMAFLNGQETPTIQTAQANFETLGIHMRGFFDFGAAMQNPRAGVKSNGA